MTSGGQLSMELEVDNSISDIDAIRFS